MAASLTCSAQYIVVALLCVGYSVQLQQRVFFFFFFRCFYPSVPSAPSGKHAQQEFQVVSMVLVSWPCCYTICGGGAGTHAECGCAFQLTRCLWGGDLSQRCLFLVIRNTWMQFRRGNPARELVWEIILWLKTSTGYNSCVVPVLKMIYCLFCLS